MIHVKSITNNKSKKLNYIVIVQSYHGYAIKTNKSTPFLGINLQINVALGDIFKMNLGLIPT